MTSSLSAKTLLIADDHPVVLRGILDFIANEADLKVVASCTNGTKALEGLRALRPDIAVLDVAMPEMTGLEVLVAAREERLDTKIVLLTASVKDSEVLEAVAAGVEGLMLKDSAPDELIDCLRAVLAGRRWLPQQMVNLAIGRETERRGKGQQVADALTVREIEIATCIAKGLSNKEIARDLSLTEGTVKIHLHNIYQKLGVNNRAALAALAVNYLDQVKR